MFVFDPDTEDIDELANLSEIVGEGDMKAIPQGKSHVNFYERDGKLYFATHVGVHGPPLDLILIKNWCCEGLLLIRV